ncbi:MAG TPA: DUF2269 family protein [Acidimicrobiales bacterium]|nr:DUF2269 family protein [Acidimicrobiales bacterium]
MTYPAGPAVVHSVPTGAGYSVLLLLHVGCAVIGFGAVAVTGVQARRARRGPEGPGADGVRRYFRPGVNWAARALYGVPVFGFALVSASAGAFSSGDGFVVIGLGLWALSAVAAEVVLWPGERRIQTVVSGGWEASASDERFDSQCRRVSGAATALSLVFLAAFVVMVGKP